MIKDYNSPEIEIISLTFTKDVLAPSDEVIATEGFIESRPDGPEDPMIEPDD